MQLEILLVIVMKYIGTIMSKIIYVLFLNIILNNQLYWDLGIGISSQPYQPNSLTSIELSTFHRIEGLKKYYIDDFSSAIFHFEQLKDTDQTNILYEYIDSYCSIGEYEYALSILNSYDHASLSENVLYLQSRIFTMIGDHAASILLLKQFKIKFPDSDYLDIINFDLERLNLLKQ